MTYDIIVNPLVLQRYRSELAPLNVRLFLEPYFYTLKDYQRPLDLEGMHNYLSYVTNVNIYTSATFIDFVNILLVLSYLYSENYQGEVHVYFTLLNKSNLKEAIFATSKLVLSDYQEVDQILQKISDKQPINNLKINLTGFINYLNFYNNLIDSQRFLMNIDEILEELEDDEFALPAYFANKYANMGLDETFYQNYLKENGYLKED